MNKEQKQQINAVAKHFGLNVLTDVSETSEPNVFEICFDVAQNPNKKAYAVEVVTRDSAISNEKDFDDNYAEGMKIADIMTENTIGAYARLAGTDYFFKWI